MANARKMKIDERFGPKNLINLPARQNARISERASIKDIQPIIERD